MVGIVAVSHSRALAEAAVALASEMVAENPPRLLVAAGMPDGGFGTDAVAVAEAIGEADDGSGVLVLMDLGSAVLSAEMALEFLPDPDTRVRIVGAPFVEGMLAAAIRAAGGGSLDEVAAEAQGALNAKREQLGEEADALSAVGADSAGASGWDDSAAAPGELGADASATATLINPLGLHARPAAAVAAAASKLVAAVRLALPGRAPVSALSPLSVAGLGTRAGDEVTVLATGPAAQEAVDSIRALIASGFGEVAGEPDSPDTPGGVPDGPHYPHATWSNHAAAPGGPGTTPEASTEPEAFPAPPTPRAHRTRGLGVSPGRVVGPVARMGAPIRVPARQEPLAPALRAAEAATIGRATGDVSAQLRSRAEHREGEVAAVLQASAALAADPTIVETASAAVLEQGVSAELAVWETLTDIAEQFRAQGGAQAERASDILDLRSRLVSSLRGEQPPGLPSVDGPYVLVATDLAPADTAELSAQSCLAIVSAEGGPTSHTAILARALGIPAVVGSPEAAGLEEGTTVLVDGGTGEFITEPSEELAAGARTVGLLPSPAVGPIAPGRTKDGHDVALLANVGGPQDVGRAAAAGAQGVGLFRTEFCFLDRESAPSEDEQAGIYEEVLRGFAGSKVVTRTLDAGSDKPLPFLPSGAEENPALGVRGLRTALADPGLLVTQLQAIARASRAVPEADVWVMAPMVSTAQEAAWFADLARGVGLATEGVMVETPAAALSAGDLLETVDFLSLGTNDLTQYTLAADRLSAELAELNDPWQPAVLRLIAAVTAGAEAAGGKPVGVCGEAAADPLLARVLVGLGVDSLSMSAGALPGVATALAEVTFAQCRAAAQAALAASSSIDSKEAAGSCF